MVQLAPVLADRDATLARLDALLPRAADCRLVVLPELCNSGYNFTSRTMAWETSESLDGSPFLDHLIRFCAGSGTYLVTGLNERAGSRLYNSAVLLGPEGVLGSYHKLHLFMDERDHFTPGEQPPPVHDLGFLRVGLLVCFDWYFPESWRLLALGGADLVAHPANLVLPGRCQQAVPVQAMMNRFYVATANRTGREGDLAFTGCSLLAGPDGTVLAEGPPGGEAVLRAVVEPGRARDKRVTSRNHILRDRRPEAYSALARDPGAQAGEERS